uniref:Endonuclease/exonuclease/phosphatase domain-containing protein n=1 Tax=Micrurus carvalhoi TaxID=3147026 RepID=A0A2H6N762_9SAUR
MDQNIYIMSDLTILVLNVNGMTSSLKRYRILRMAKENKVDIMILTETHNKRGKRDKVINDNNWKWVYESRGNGSRGTAILIHQRVLFEEIDVQRDREGRWLFVKGKMDQMKLTVAAIYAPNVNPKQFILNTKRKLDNFMEGTTFLAGDFTMQLTTGMGNRRTLNLNKLNMVDIHADLLNRSTYYSARHNTFSWIDYILMNRMGNIQIKKSEIKSIWLSDHAPLLAILKTGQERIQRIWRYNVVVSSNESDKLKMQTEIREYFRINDTGEIQQSIIWDTCKAFIRGQCISLEAYIRKRWGREREKKIREIDWIQEQLRITRRREWNTLLKLKKKQLELQEEIQWNKMRMVMRQKISGWGTKSMKQMARYLKNKKEKSCILALRDSNGVVRYGIEQLEEIMKRYYEDLYKTEQVNVGVINVSKRVSDEDKQILNAEITPNEISKVIKGLKQAKAPALMGIRENFIRRI